MSADWTLAYHDAGPLFFSFFIGIWWAFFLYGRHITILKWNVERRGDQGRWRSCLLGMLGKGPERSEQFPIFLADSEPGNDIYFSICYCIHPMIVLVMVKSDILFTQEIPWHVHLGTLSLDTSHDLSAVSDYFKIDWIRKNEEFLRDFSRFCFPSKVSVTKLFFFSYSLLK